MSLTRQILWIDNDAALVFPSQHALEAAGYHVTIAQTVADASRLLSNNNYDLVILDVMIPLTADDEAAGYSPKLTDYGGRTGLAFYQKNRDTLAASGSSIIVMTVRVDQDIVDRFVRAGLPRECFLTKFQARDPKELIRSIIALIGPNKI